MAGEVLKSRDSFVFYRSYFESIRELPAESQLALYAAIMESVFCDEVTEITDPIARAFMMLITPQIEATLKRYDTSVANGKKKGKQNPTPTQAEPDTNPKATQEEPKGNPTPTQAEPDTNPSGDLNYNYNLDYDYNDNYDLDYNENSNENFSLRASEAEQREKFLEIFIFEKNMREPREEVERFYNHYAAMDWKRKGEPIADRIALARSWSENPSNRGEPRKFTPEFLKKWRVLYAATAKQDKTIANLLLTELTGVRECDERLELAITDKLNKIIQESWSGFFKPFFDNYFPNKKICKI